jgi:alkanesulfonate monooxygenase SsuD/methylene tetrahydromethanopterin reductase-like flavin-dependent oxidoreductase (luciferase family)
VVVSDWELIDAQREPLKRFGNHPSLRFGLLWPTASGRDRWPNVLDPAAHAQLAVAAESAGFDYALLPDGRAGSGTGIANAGLRSVLWSVPVILATESIGVLTALRTTFMHPTHIARFGAHLDFMSGGRWGWYVTTGTGDDNARRYGLDGMPSLEARYAMAEEAISAVTATWLVRRGEELRFAGNSFHIRGMVKRPPPVQAPRPLLVGGGSSTPARRLAATQLDWFVTQVLEPGALGRLVDDLRRGAETVGREQPVRVMVEIGVSADAARSPGTLDTILAGRDAGAAGFLLRVDDWTPAAIAEFSDLFALALDAGAWVPPGERAYEW